MRPFVRIFCVSKGYSDFFLVDTNCVRLGGVVFNYITHKYVRVIGMGWERLSFVVHVRDI